MSHPALRLARPSVRFVRPARCETVVCVEEKSGVGLGEEDLVGVGAGVAAEDETEGGGEGGEGVPGEGGTLW